MGVAMELFRALGDAVAKPPRRTQAERSALTRERVIEAAIWALRSKGYAGASIHVIRAEAGVSLGALQHQFPSKSSLMAAVLGRFGERRLARYRAAAQGARTNLERFSRILDCSWGLAQDNDFSAFLEIDLARRSDPELDGEVTAILEQLDAQLTAFLYGEAPEPGAIDREAFEVLRAVNNMLIRGAALNLAVHHAGAMTLEAIDAVKPLILELLTRALSRPSSRAVDQDGPPDARASAACAVAP